MSEARDILDRYLVRTGLSRPADAAQQFQVTLMRQWVEHLDEVLEANGVPGQLRVTIVREFIYGVVPQQAEESIRANLVQEMKDLHERGPLRPFAYRRPGGNEECG